MLFKFGVPCFVVKNIEAKFLGIDAFVRFWTINKRKLTHVFRIAVLHLLMKSNENPTDPQMNLNNSMNI